MQYLESRVMEVFLEKLLGETSLLAGLIASTLVLLGAEDLNWKRAYIIVVGSGGCVYYGTPWVLDMVPMLSNAQGLVGFIGGLAAIKFLDWFSALSFKEILNAVLARISRK